jgi:hypothetical protein
LPGSAAIKRKFRPQGGQRSSRHRRLERFISRFAFRQTQHIASVGIADSRVGDSGTFPRFSGVSHSKQKWSPPCIPTGMPDESWLNMTNAILGGITLICVVVIAAGAFRTVAEKLRARAHTRRVFVFEELGATMADGGEPIDKRNPKSRN